MKTNRENTISRIIEARQSNSAHVEKQARIVYELEGSINELMHLRNAILPQLDEVHRPAMEAIGAVMENTRQKIADFSVALQRLRNRYSRKTINIGIVGVPSQGKSTVLQALTGLDDSTIPTGSAYVTGACSYLCHDASVPAGDAFADITPYSREEFLNEVLRPFCNVFNLTINSVEELQWLQLPQKSDNMLTTSLAQLDRLEQLQKNYASYKHLLGTQTQRISKAQIREYVAQCDESGMTLHSNWYAIKKAEIHCCFPQTDIGRIMMCDTPGLGDFTPGAKRALLKKISDDMDVVFFLKKLILTDQEPSERDTELHDVIKEANPVFNASDWVYVLLNCTRGESPSPVFIPKLRAKLASRNKVYQLVGNDPESVGATFDEILEDIVYQLPNLDQKLQEHHEASVQELQIACEALVKKAEKTMPKPRSHDDYKSLVTDVRKIINTLTEKLLSLKMEVASSAVLDSVQSFESNINATLDSMLQSCPDLPISETDRQNPMAWMAEGWDSLRASFISRFSELDSALQQVTSMVRSRMEAILASAEGGRLAFVADGDVTGKGFWQNLQEVLAESLDEEDAAYLIQTIDNLVNTEFTFRAIIMPRLTELTDALSTTSTHPDFACTRYSNGDSIELCRTHLQSAWKLAIFKARAMFDANDGELKDINTVPAKALASLIDEFYLRWLNYKGKSNAFDIWCSFYQKHAAETWPEVYSDSNSNFAAARSWSNALKSFAQKCNQF